MLDAFLSPSTLLIKGLGLALSVASGLSLGKEVRDWRQTDTQTMLIDCIRDLSYTWLVAWHSYCFPYPLLFGTMKVLAPPTFLYLY